MKHTHRISAMYKALPSAILFGIAFMVTGYIIPNLYYRFFDSTNYYEIKIPLPVEERVYKPCELVDVYIVRKSLIDTQGDSIINLALIRDGNENRERISTETKRISITKGDGTIITHWQLPCMITSGEYFFEGTVKYEVRGFEKYTPFYTQSFLVGDKDTGAN